MKASDSVWIPFAILWAIIIALVLADVFNWGWAPTDIVNEEKATCVVDGRTVELSKEACDLLGTPPPSGDEPADDPQDDLTEAEIEATSIVATAEARATEMAGDQQDQPADDPTPTPDEDNESAATSTGIPQTEDQAAQVLQTDASYLDAEYSGTSNITGWIIGSKNSESGGVVIRVGHVPAGTCVDYDPGATEVSGQYEVVDEADMRRRVKMTSDGSLEGLKATIYWTPCRTFEGGSASGSDNDVALAPTSTAEAGALSPAEEIAQVVGGDADHWRQIDGTTNGWRYEGPEVVLTVPEGAFLDYEGGRALPGQSVTTSDATLWYA